ncbi:MAG: DNA translocase FtsK [Clostridium sp.]|nr:DNA translocase FtsK [Clostridium sp.]
MDNIATDGFDPDAIDDPFEPLNIRTTRDFIPGEDSDSRETEQPRRQQTPAVERQGVGTSRQATTTSGSATEAAAERRRSTDVPAGRNAARASTSRPTSSDRVNRTATGTDRGDTERGGALQGIDMSINLSFFKDGRFTSMLGVITLCASLYFLIVTISFFNTGAADQSELAMGSSETVGNAGGVLGALLANTFLSRWLGFGSFIIIGYLVCLGLALVRAHKFNIPSLTVKSLFSAISVSIIAGFLSLNFVSTFHWGGEHGFYINTIVNDLFNSVGNVILCVALLLILAVIFLHELTAFVTMVIDRYRRLRTEVRNENERREVAETAEAPAEAGTPAGETAPRQSVNIETTERSAQKETTGTSEPVATMTEAEIHEPIIIDESRLPSPRPQATLEDIDDTPTDNYTDRDDFTVEDNAPDETKAAAIPTQREHIAAQKIEVLPANRLTETGNSEKTEKIEMAATETEPSATFRTAPEIEEAKTEQRDAYDPTAELSRYRFPALDLLIPANEQSLTIDVSEQEEDKKRITAILNSFGTPISHIEATIGPTVTLYEIVPAEGVRIARIKSLEDDIARSIAAVGTRIIAPIPGKETVGIEVPNKAPQVVRIRSILGSRDFQECRMELPMAMGVTISNKVYIADLTKMPHLLVAGATGMGKSVGLNTIIASLLYKKHPAELKFVMVDPKMVEFSLYNKIENHYLAKLPDEESAIITDPQKVVPTLNSLCVEMDNRYALLKDAYVRSISEYNRKFQQRSLNPDKGHRYLPYIVVVVDEFADLIMTSGKEVEQPIARIAQKARAVGIHLILATQRPSTNVITGIIKANFPGRIAFRVFQMVDSRTILDRPGANQLIGRGDMLFSRDGIIDRVQCALIETEEVQAICDSIGDQIGYPEPYLLPEILGDGSEMNAGAVGDVDPLFPDVARWVVATGTASASSLQTRYTIGYPRARKIMEQLEQFGVVGAQQGAKPRQVLIDSLALERFLENKGIN